MCSVQSLRHAEDIVLYRKFNEDGSLSPLADSMESYDDAYIHCVDCLGNFDTMGQALEHIKENE